MFGMILGTLQRFKDDAKETKEKVKFKVFKILDYKKPKKYHTRVSAVCILHSNMILLFLLNLMFSKCHCILINDNSCCQ